MENVEKMKVVLPISEEKGDLQREAWYEAIDDVMLTSTNLKVATEVAYQNQGEDRDFDHWIMDKIREEVIALEKVVREAHDKGRAR